MNDQSRPELMGPPRPAHLTSTVPAFPKNHGLLSLPRDEECLAFDQHGVLRGRLDLRQVDREVFAGEEERLLWAEQPRWTRPAQVLVNPTGISLAGYLGACQREDPLDWPVALSPRQDWGSPRQSAGDDAQGLWREERTRACLVLVSDDGRALGHSELGIAIEQDVEDQVLSFECVQMSCYLRPEAWNDCSLLDLAIGARTLAQALVTGSAEGLPEGWTLDLHAAADLTENDAGAISGQHLWLGMQEAGVALCGGAPADVLAFSATHCF